MLQGQPQRYSEARQLHPFRRHVLAWTKVFEAKPSSTLCYLLGVCDDKPERGTPAVGPTSIAFNGRHVAYLGRHLGDRFRGFCSWEHQACRPSPPPIWSRRGARRRRLPQMYLGRYQQQPSQSNGRNNEHLRVALALGVAVYEICASSQLDPQLFSPGKTWCNYREYQWTLSAVRRGLVRRPGIHM